MFKNILLPTDGSNLSEDAIRKGILFAREQNSRVIGLYVIPEPTPGDIWDVWSPDSEEGKVFKAKFESQLECVARNYLKVVEEIAQGAGVSCESLYLKGISPSDGILKVAKERNCDLIFMASHGRTGMRAALGSVTLKVLAGSGVPVLVYR
ncbi:MAG: universal stress protein [Thermodesulfovibrionales bacterium]